ncbi:microviridin/marinostatin family tricyclic proteinase inhibitor [Taibaiella koreensis]|uniref:microviridin/marinostatin family tricyclic proteinase inhibitor n=1 Tax=Taibaiella koreensis TaxID=1268548 RepID=UPI000E59A6B9|nr:microviridin/marinostatin family tricyclic proteinase inhibitor [Taibaiella koreensis]
MKKQNLQKPFFSAFLENQMDKQNEDKVQGGDNPPIHTMSLADSPQTQKYPSDQEDTHTKPLADMAQTQKYPSDGDDDPMPIDL